MMEYTGWQRADEAFMNCRVIRKVYSLAFGVSSVEARFFCSVGRSDGRSSTKDPLSQEIENLQ